MHSFSVFAMKALGAGAIARLGRSYLRGVAWALTMIVATSSAALAATYYVDGANPSATDAGPGSISVPYKTIQAAVTARGTAGNIILVRPTIYRETVNISQSGTSSSRIVLQASPTGAVINGSDDFANPSKWINIAGNVYLASTVTWSPGQVFKNGARLAASASPPASIPSNAFRYVAGIGLYVNVGGGNPGLQNLEVGRRLNGVLIPGRYVTLDGFKVTQTDDKAVYVTGSNALIQNNNVSFANHFGIQLAASLNSSVLTNVVGDNNDHGIFVSDTSTTARIAFNESFRNAKPGVRSANGIDIDRSASCTVENNRCYDNQDSGIQFYSGSNNCISRNNISYRNGDHGYDHLLSTGIKHIHDIAYGNFKDGFSIEGTSTGATLYNCIGVDNGITQNEYNLWVDEASFASFTSDNNIFWNSTSQSPVKIGTTVYATVAAYAAARGKDGTSKQLDPKFILPATGNFRPMSGSPAIDCARGGVSSWPATDFEGLARFDDPATSNTGNGSPTYADRGVHEYRPAGLKPVAALVLNPTRGDSPLLVTANASGSSDPDGSVAAYLFNFGDGTTVGPQTSPIATHTYAPGIWTVTLSVIDNLGQITTATAKDTVIQGDSPPVVTVPSTISADEGQVTQIAVTVNDPDGQAIDSLTVDTTGLPGAGTATFTTNATRTSGTFTFTPPANSNNVTPFNITFRAKNAKVGTAVTAITIQKANLFPTAALTVAPRSGNNPLFVTADASASSDPDGSIATYRFDFGDGTIVGPQAGPTATHSYGVGNYNVTVIVTDNKGAGSISAAVSVQSLGSSANLAPNPGLETNSTGWNASGPDTVTRVTGTGVGRTGSAALQMKSAATNSATLFGANDSGDIVNATNSGPAGKRYHYEAWVRSVAHQGSAKIRIREYNAGVLQGAAVFSPAVTLSPTWQKLSFDYTAQATNSTIDFNVLDQPAVAGEIFLMDDVLVQSTATSQPIVTAPASATGAENTVITFTVNANDPDGEAILAFSPDFSGLPGGHNASFSVNAAKTQGTFSWTPTLADARPAAYNVVFIASNTGVGQVTVPLLVTNVDRAPTVTSPAAAAVTETQEVTFQVTAADPDNEAITSLTSSDLSGLPGATFTPNASNTGGTFAWTPGLSAGPGTYTVVFTVANALTARDTTVITVADFDRAPIVVAPETHQGVEGQTLTFGVSAFDLDDQPITSLIATTAVLPNGSASFVPTGNNTSGTLTWTPGFSDSGTYVVVFTAANSLTGRDTTIIHIGNSDLPPVVNAAATVTVNEGQALSFGITASDPENDPITSLTADVTGLPAGIVAAAFAPGGGNTSGTLTWTPGFSDSGSYTVVFTAANGLTGSDTTIVQVVNVDRAPVVTAPATAVVAENDTLVVTVTAVDPDGDVINSIAANTLGLPPAGNPVFTPAPGNSGGTLRWRASPGDYVHNPLTIPFTASNALNGTATTLVTVDRIPVVTVQATASTNENQQVVITVTAFDPDAQAITTLTADTTGLAHPNNSFFSTNAAKTQGTFSWTPTFNDAPGPYTVKFIATNTSTGRGETAITVVQVDRAPAVTSPEAVTVVEGQGAAVPVTAADPDGDPITILDVDVSAFPSGNLPGFSTNGAKTAGTLTWTPNHADAGPYPAIFTVTANGLTAKDTTLISVDHKPEVTAFTSATATENQELVLNITAADSDPGQPLTSLVARLTGLPAGNTATFTPNAQLTGGTLKWKPTFDDAPGPYVVTFIASNAATDSASTTITVTAVDRAPVVTAPPTAFIGEGQALSFGVTAADLDVETIDSLRVDVSRLPGGNNANFQVNATRTAGTLTWTPQAGDGAGGPYLLIFTARNALSGVDSTVVTVDRAPVVSVSATATATENQPFTLTVSAADPDGQAIADLTADLSALGAGAGFSVNGAHTIGTVTWTPGFTKAPGPYTVSFTATNTLNGSATSSITVVNVDRAPAVTLAPTATVAEGSQLSLAVSASDPDGEAITSMTPNFTALPAGNNAAYTPINASSGTITWTPTPAMAPGPYTISFTAANDLSGSASSSVTINRSPFITVAGSVTATENVDVALAITATDLDNDPIQSLTANTNGLPAGSGATFAPNGTNTGGTLHWTPKFTDAPGPYTVTFTAVSSVAGMSGTSSTSITVGNVDRAPVITAPVSAAAAVGSQVSLHITAVDPDGDAIATLTANTNNLPAGNALFTPDPGNTGGTLTWTPQAGDGHGPFTVSFTATAASGPSGTASTSITNDRPPVVTVVATAGVNENQLLTLTVTASDPDGDPITSLGLAPTPPAGASFSANGANTSGTFTWTPTFNDGRVAPYDVTFTAANALSRSGTTSITVGNVDRAPVVTVAPTQLVNEGQLLSFGVTASDPDGDAISTLEPSYANLPAASGASFTPLAGNTGGTFTWTPAVGVGRVAAYAVPFTATNLMSGFSTSAITVNKPPTAALSLSPGSGTQPLTVTANAAASSDLDGSIASYTFNFGDGTTVGPQLSATAPHVFSAGTFTVTVTVVDNRGSSATASQSITISAAPPNLASNPGFETDLSGWLKNGTATLTRLAPGRSGGFCLEIRTTSTGTFGITDSPNMVPNVSGAGVTYYLSAWVRSAVHRGQAKIKVREFVGSTQQGSSAYSTGVVLSPTWQQVTFTYVTRTAGSFLDIEFNDYPVATSEIMQIDDIVVTTAAAAPDQAPVVIAPATATINENGQLSVSVTASDPDGNAITTLAANLGNLPGGHNAVFTPNASRTAGTLTWTPTFADGRALAYNVTFTASNALSGSATTAITVNNVDRAPVVTSPATAAAQKGVQMTLSVTVADPDGDAITTLTANNASALPSASTFTANASKTGGTLTWIAQPADGPGPYNVIFTATNALTGRDTTAIAVTNPPVVTAPVSATVNENQLLTITVNVNDPDGDPITTLTANTSGLPAGNAPVFTVNAAKTQGTLTWTPTFVNGQAAPYTVTFTATNAASGSASTAITVTNVDRAPIVTAGPTVTIAEGTLLSLTITASDPDSEAITNITANLTGLPAGHNAVFTMNAAKRGGTLTWTPTSADGRATPPYNVTFTAANALSGSATTAITVTDVPAGGTNLVTNPGFETNTTGWLKNGTATLTRVAGGHSGGFCAQVTTTASSTFGITDSPNTVTSVPAAGITYRLTAWVRSAAHRGAGKIKVREFVGTTQQGSSTYSTGVTLSPTWQQITLDYVTRTAGSFLDVEVNDYPIAASEIIQIDDVSIVRLSPAQQPGISASQPADLAFRVSLTPNPIRGEGVLDFTTTRPGAVRFAIFDITGRLVREPMNESFVAAGRHSLGFSIHDRGSRLAAGTYFYRLHAAEGVRNGRFVVLE